MATFKDAIAAFLLAKGTEFPEVEAVHTELNDITETCAALVTTEPENQHDTGANTTQAITQDGIIAILYHVGQGDENTIAALLEPIGLKVLNTVKADLTLNGFCISLRIKRTERGKVPVQANKYRYFRFFLEGKWFREVA